MVDTEEYFPRGGKKPTIKYFKQSGNFLGAAEKGEKKKKKQKKHVDIDDDGYLSDEAAKAVDQSYKNCALRLTMKTMKQGVLILGRVGQIHDTKLIVVLPGKMSGTVMACHISEPYNKLLEAYVNDQIDKVTDLSAMFRRGQYVIVKVLEIEENRVMLSMMPQHVNSGRTHIDLQKGDQLQGAVVSVEDHGYIMDIGIQNTRPFLPKANTNPEIELEVGMLTWCCVKSLTSSDADSIVTLTNQLEALQRATPRHKTIGQLTPATPVQFTVHKPLDNGIEGRVLGGETAYVQRDHADHVKGNKPKLGQKIRARVLYVMPTRNTPFLTMKDIFATTHPDMDAEQKLKEGEIIDDARVMRILGRSVYFKLGQGCTGAMSLRNIQVDENLADEEVIAKSYPLGSVHKVRVLSYHLSDYTYSVSDRADALRERYFTVEQLQVGDLVDGTVAQVADDHVLLDIGRVRGYVPHTHLFDAGILVDPKKASNSKLPKKKYKVGQNVRARVLLVDQSKQTVLLSLKPTLLSPDLEVLHSYEQAQIGKSYTGCIRLIRDYILVTFFNNVTAFVPRQYVSREHIENLTDAYHLGQIVHCTIVKVYPNDKKMTGSFVTEPFFDKVREKGEKRKKSNEDGNEVPTKKKKCSLEEIEEKEKKGKKKPAVETEEDFEQSEETKPKKKKKEKNSESEGVNSESDHIETDLNEEIDKKKRKNKKTIKIEEVNEVSKVSYKSDVIETKKTKRKKQAKNSESKEANSESDHIETDFNEEIGKKKKNKKNTESVDINEETDKKKRKSNKYIESEVINEVSKVSEESDAIETDIYEDMDPVLTPQDYELIDLTNCNDIKKCRKRVISLLKSINARQMRIDRIEQKIAKLEKKGLNARNKMYHTAMHAEILMVQERAKKLLEALKIVQERLIELGYKETSDKIEFSVEIKEKIEDESNNDTIVEENNSSSGKKNVVENTKKKSKEKKQKKEKEEVNEKTNAKKIELKVAESLKPAIEVPSAKEFWSVTTSQPEKQDQEDDLSSTDDEQKEQPKKKRKKLSAAEKVAKVREEEERVRQMEQRAIESESQPRSSEQFERALLAHPDCSQLWIAYMAFHLQATEIEKARAVGRKALSTISFREEQEKLNVWLAMLNLENRFGTKESQQKTLEEALQMNEPFTIHSKLLDIYVETGKQSELVSLVELMVRKYRRETSAYVLAGTACFKLGLVDKARHVMQKAISVLEKKEHINVLVQFALLERSFGSRERAEALFEQVLAVYPQRVDVLAAYVDMLLKGGDVEQVRQVMERMTSQKLPARKMKVLYKKWIEVEEKIGGQEQVESIRKRAMEYIEKAKF